MRITYLTAIIIIFLSCSESHVKTQIQEKLVCDTLNFEILEKMLGSNLNKLSSFNCYIQRDTILEGDEGVNWNGKSFYFKEKIAFIAEADWENTKTVKRITVLSPIVKEGKIYVGQTFKEIKHLVKTEVPSSPDGYLFLNSKNNEDVFIQLDISKEPSDSPLFKGVKEIGKIPETLIVESIVIRKTK